MLDDITITKPQSNTQQPQWMLSFADLMSLILTFFVLIYSMGKPIHKDNIYDDDRKTVVNANPDNKRNSVHIQRTDENMSTNYLLNVVQTKFDADPTLSKFKVGTEDDKIVIEINRNVFDPQSQLKLANVLRTIDNDTKIFSSKIDTSFEVSNKFTTNGLNKKMDILASHKIIDPNLTKVVIYP